MRYSKIREMDISNGEGIGVSLFVQGCHFHCKGCFNQETWDFNGGEEWTIEVEESFLNAANKPYITRISILGGEPLADENVKEVLTLLSHAKNLYPDKEIWLYTGYTIESIFNNSEADTGSLARREAIKSADVVVDGQFQLDKQDLYNEEIVWAGSTNQRVIFIKELDKYINL